MDYIYFLPEPLRLQIVKKVVEDLSADVANRKESCEVLVREYEDFMYRVRYHPIPGDWSVARVMAFQFMDLMGNLPQGVVLRVNRRHKFWRVWMEAFSHTQEDVVIEGNNRAIIGEPSGDIGDDIVVFRYGVHVAPFLFDRLLSNKRDELVRKLLFLKKICI